jgi:peptidoglycan/xylan/chitin deacetylase (PgdA/CDA1 family)
MKRTNIIRTVFELALVVALALTVIHIRANESWRLGVTYRVPTDEKVVALTFDDGPDPRFTPGILDSLDQYGVKATFFEIGRNMVKHPDIVKEVLRRGHVIGNHTYTHPHNIEADTQAQISSELERCEKVIEKMTGRRAHLFRPPRGLVDGTVFTVAEEQGYKTILWTVCADHHDAPTPEDMAARVLKHIRPGAIILAHDGQFCTRWKDVAATPLIIQELKKRGYRFVTVPELLEIGAKDQRRWRL